MEDGQEEHELYMAYPWLANLAADSQPRGGVRTTYNDEHDDENQLDASKYILELAKDLHENRVSAEKVVHVSWTGL